MLFNSDPPTTCGRRVQQEDVGGDGACRMPNEFPGREVTNLVALFQRAHSKVVALARMDDQIAAMVVQHERLQDEIRVVQNEINHEFERTLKFNQAPSKLPGTIGVTPAIAAGPMMTPMPAVPQGIQPSPSPLSGSATMQSLASAPFSDAHPSNGETPDHEEDISAEVIPLARG
jgi:hypothetical protein